MYRTIGKIIAGLLALTIAIIIFLFIASSKKGDNTTMNDGISTTGKP